MNIFLPIILTFVWGAQKNRLIETVLLSAHNICLDKEKYRKFLITHFYLDAFKRVKVVAEVAAVIVIVVVTVAVTTVVS